MDSIKRLLNDIGEHRYRELKAINYSLLSSVKRNGPKSLVYTEKLETSYLTFGSLVDTLLTCKDRFDELFLLDKVKNPSKNIKEVLDALHKNGFKSINKDFCINYCNENNLYGSMKEDIIMKKINTGKKYFDVLSSLNGRSLISKDEYDSAERCVNTLKYNIYTKDLIDIPEFNNNTEHIFQAIFVLDLGGLRFKAMMDKIIVDHDKKTIQIVDLKTTSEDECNWLKSYIKYDYDLQASFYTFVLKNVIKNDDYFKDFEVLPFKFVVINRYNLTPFVYEDHTYDMVKDGYHYYYNDNKVKSFVDLIKEIEYYDKHQRFDYPLDFIKNKGKIIINIFKKKIDE